MNLKSHCGEKGKVSLCVHRDRSLREGAWNFMREQFGFAIKGAGH